VTIRATVHAPELVSARLIRDIKLKHPFVQPLPDEQLLLVGARCHCEAAGLEKNALIVDNAGNAVREGTVGDGITHVLTTSAGAVWIGYSDEGVFGYGDDSCWERAGMERLGSNGIVTLDRDLDVSWCFPERFPPGSIFDCYALNLAGDTAWACYYDRFPLVRIDGGVVSAWQNKVSSAEALIVADSDVALIGGYEANRWRVVLGTLTTSTFVPRSRFRLTLPDGRTPEAARLIGRGDELHAFVDQSWFKLNVGDLQA
jgi:hypothetical protein